MVLSNVEVLVCLTDCIRKKKHEKHISYSTSLIGSFSFENVIHRQKRDHIFNRLGSVENY